jgi:hypothetical protein
VVRFAARPTRRRDFLTALLLREPEGKYPSSNFRRESTDFFSSATPLSTVFPTEEARFRRDPFLAAMAASASERNPTLRSVRGSTPLLEKAASRLDFVW